MNGCGRAGGTFDGDHGASAVRIERYSKNQDDENKSFEKSPPSKWLILGAHQCLRFQLFPLFDFWGVEQVLIVPDVWLRLQRLSTTKSSTPT